MTDKGKEGNILTQVEVEQIFSRKLTIHGTIDALLTEGYQPHQIADFFNPRIVDEQVAFEKAVMNFPEGMDKAEKVKRLQAAGFDNQLVQIIEKLLK